MFGVTWNGEGKALERSCGLVGDGVSYCGVAIDLKPLGVDPIATAVLTVTVPSDSCLLLTLIVGGYLKFKDGGIRSQVVIEQRNIDSDSDQIVVDLREVIFQLVFG